MMVGVRIRVTGLKEALERLAVLERKVRTKIVRAALKDGAKIILRDMKQRAPISTDERLAAGLLKKALGTRTKVYRQSGVVVVAVGPRAGFKRNRKTNERTR